MSIDAMKQALSALDWAADHIEPRKPDNCDCPVCVASNALRLAIEQAEQQEQKPMHPEMRKMWEDYFDKCFRERFPLTVEQAEKQEPVACSVCKEVHAILDADESQIIRNAEDGYPDGRKPRILTLQERVNALCVYASDWKRWCLEKENAAPPQQEKQKPVAWANINKHGDITHTSNKQMPWANTPLYTAPPQRQPLTDEEIKGVIRAGEYDSMEEFARAIERASGVGND